MQNETHKILLDFAIQMGHLILVRRLDLVLIDKKENLLPSGFCHSSKSQTKNKRTGKDKQILGPYQRTKKKKTVEHADDSDTNCSWCAQNILKGWKKRLEQLKIKGRIISIQIQHC